MLDGRSSLSVVNVSVLPSVIATEARAANFSAVKQAAAGGGELEREIRDNCYLLKCRAAAPVAR